MLSLKEFLTEALVGNKLEKQIIKPKNKAELINIINDRIKLEGPECNLNDIDVSEITDMTELFRLSKFNGNISEWDVSNVENMAFMFDNSKYTGENGDLSKWDFSLVTNISYMFYKSAYNGKLNFNAPNLAICKNAFHSCKNFIDLDNISIPDNAKTEDMCYKSPMSKVYGSTPTIENNKLVRI